MPMKSWRCLAVGENPEAMPISPASPPLALRMLDNCVRFALSTKIRTAFSLQAKFCGAQSRACIHGQVTRMGE